MTKRKSKSTKSTVKAAAAKGVGHQIVRRACDRRQPSADRPWLRRPAETAGCQVRRCQAGPRNQGRRPMGFKVYEASSEDVAEYAKKLPLGRLYANGRGFVPNVRQDLYSDLVVALGLEPQAALSTNGDKDSLPAARGLPRSWDEIGPGHLVIAQESLDYGWWEAIVLDRQGDTFILQYRDYPHLPKFVRHRSGIAMMSPPTDEAKPAAQAEQA